MSLPQKGNGSLRKGPKSEAAEGDSVKIVSRLINLLSLMSREIPFSKDMRRDSTSPALLGDEACRLALPISVLL